MKSSSIIKWTHKQDGKWWEGPNLAEVLEYRHYKCRSPDFWAFNSISFILVRTKYELNDEPFELGKPYRLIYSEPELDEPMKYMGMLNDWHVFDFSFYYTKEDIEDYLTTGVVNVYEKRVDDAFFVPCESDNPKEYLKDN